MSESKEKSAAKRHPEAKDRESFAAKISKERRPSFRSKHDDGGGEIKLKVGGHLGESTDENYKEVVEESFSAHKSEPFSANEDDKDPAESAEIGTTIGSEESRRRSFPNGVCVPRGEEQGRETKNEGNFSWHSTASSEFLLFQIGKPDITPFRAEQRAVSSDTFQVTKSFTS